jgi:hypothetical protein
MNKKTEKPRFTLEAISKVIRLCFSRKDAKLLSRKTIFAPLALGAFA